MYCAFVPRQPHKGAELLDAARRAERLLALAAARNDADADSAGEREQVPLTRDVPSFLRALFASLAGSGTDLEVCPGPAQTSTTTAAAAAAARTTAALPSALAGALAREHAEQRVRLARACAQALLARLRAPQEQ